MITQTDTPFVPRKFIVYPVGRAGSTRRGGKTVKCWDVRGHADGRQFFRRFTAPEETAEMAKKYARDLVAGYEAGLLWDPQSRRFVEPVTEKHVSVYDWCARYWTLQVDVWEPASRVWAARSLSRAVLGLVNPGAPPAPAVVEEHLTLAFSTRPVQPDVAAGAWLDRWSMPLAEVTHEHIENLLAKHRTKANGQPIAPATERRFAADLQACWRAAQGRGLITTNPWDAVKVGRKAKRKGKVEKGVTGVQPVDPDLVLSPAQAWKLAEAVGTSKPNAGGYKAFILTMAFCGTRPAEAMALTIGDLELPDASSVDESGWLNIRRSRRIVASKWLTDDEDPEYGPLKGRASSEARRVPIPSLLVPVLREHLELYRAGAGDDDLLFVAVEGGPIDLSRFGRDYWCPVRAQVFAGDPTLSKIRRHDLRHLACSMWLQSGVAHKMCMTWSGHQSLMVFLDEYQLLLPGSEEEGVARLEAWLKSH